MEAGESSSLAAALQHNSDIGGQRYDRARLECRVTSPDKEAGKPVSVRVLYTGVRAHHQRAVPHSAEELCQQLCRLLHPLLPDAGQRQVRVVASVLTYLPFILIR